ncbi:MULTISPECIES: phosphorylcholine transferase LicD [unclassified Lactococcus]|uniref:LicD family protein n=1 Tax=unclassified Lactococcus TaxID=2643510 RepID=UPI0011CB9BB6|nr:MULTISPECIES: LicD family protein [unclassified Lactococcus]MQW22026.1 phosphorylcholine transferase LicD [Lactococcus sp. dk101]TXK44969.1 phosphorylcholine transferase LicD [Lactococcus sp. dk310]TXK51250.1 phosphorylcholine transferase LicD [Lactococcus sp. dk322]
MKQIKNEELKSIQLEMIHYIDQVCRKNKIEYSISAGTLLGAVKYQGYIPWDDDIDIMLTRSNYEKLITLLLAQKPEKFSLLHYKERPTYLPMAKLYNNQTFFTSTLDNLNSGTGVFIDIFPVDQLPNDQREGERFKKEIRREVTHLTASRHGLAYASSEKLLYAIIKSVLWLPSHLRYLGKNSMLAEKVDLHMQKYNGSDGIYCNYVFSPPKHMAYFDKSIFAHYEDIQFEELVLRKIVDHEPFLVELYGNWKSLPKSNKIRNHSYYHWYWKE